MIKIKFKNLVEEHRFSILFIHEQTGINRNTLTDLYKGRTQRIDLDTLNRLLIFFNNYFPTTLHDLMEFTNEYHV